jgi:NAD(P)-dependent dehydrogenase (short-subunit alcohol dehydrogenase family)
VSPPAAQSRVARAHRSPFDLSGKVAVVTGGNSGLGLAFARGLGAAGASVVIWGRRSDANEFACERLRGEGIAASSADVDVRVAEQVAAAMQRAVRELGRVDCVVANAGVARRWPSFLEIGDDYHELLATNLHGAYYTIREGYRHMLARADGGDPGGSLIVVGSLLAHTGLAGLQHYAIAKSGLEGLVRCVAVEGGPHRIRCNMISPGYFVTPMNEAKVAAPDLPFTRRMRELSPSRRFGELDDIEGVAVYLASDAAAYHTGDTLHVDGGWLAWLAEQ